RGEEGLGRPRHHGLPPPGPLRTRSGARRAPSGRRPHRRADRRRALARPGQRVVPGCCNPRGCDGFFDDRFARRMAERYRKRGLDKTARKMVAFLEERGIEGATVLEIGGGVGEIQLELLKKGAARAVNVELSPAYDPEASQLLHDAGLEGRA